MQGLRTQENDSFLNYFELVQNKAKELGLNCVMLSEYMQLGKVFFMESGEGDTKNFGRYECESLSGWLIDSNDVEEFQRSYLANSDIPQKFDSCYCFADWKPDNNGFRIEFNDYQ